MNPALTQALKEAYALAPSDLHILETIELTHPNISGQLRFVSGYENVEVTLETAEVVTFEAGAFRISLPAAGDNGAQEINITMDNTDARISDFCQMAANFTEPVVIVYRPYLSNDLTTPQMDPPLLLYLKEVSITEFSVSGRASFNDIINKKFPSQLYTRSRFPSLGSGR